MALKSFCNRSHRSETPSMSQDVIAIPFVDLGTQSPQIRDEVLLRMARVMDAGRYILGFEVEEFKQAFAHYCQVPDCLPVVRHPREIAYYGIWLRIRSLGEFTIPIDYLNFSRSMERLQFFRTYPFVESMLTKFCHCPCIPR